jgi:hypothetical protein
MKLSIFSHSFVFGCMHTKSEYWQKWVGYNDWMAFMGNSFTFNDRIIAIFCFQKKRLGIFNLKKIDI